MDARRAGGRSDGQADRRTSRVIPRIRSG
jgi:hypothetical protein